MTEKILLCILDGFGINEKLEKNAIKAAKTPNLDFLTTNYPHSALDTSGLAVGLPHGQMGNSEVGHMTIGSGQVILQDLVRISKAIATKEIDQNPIIQKYKNEPVIHLMGLASDGGVHSHIDHMIYLAKFFGKNSKIYLHLFLDGRDTPPCSAIKYIEQIEEILSDNIMIATCMGRYYGMDRDKRWERIEIATDAIISCKGEKAPDLKNYIKQNYENNITDEFIKPYVNSSYPGLKKGDALIATNFRADRMRQIMSILIAKDIKAAMMTKYSNALAEKLDVIFDEINITNTLGEIIESKNLKQLRIAETEKYPHVTYFFSAGREESFKGETRILVPSPKVATYDLKPEMSAYEMLEQLEEAIGEEKYHLIVANFANADMVGHSGNFNAAIRAVEVIDEVLGRLYNKVKNHNYNMIISSDHGNIEEMFDYHEDSPHTAHTTNLVPFVLVSEKYKNVTLNNGTLADIAPTILGIMGIEQPNVMIGKTLINK